jgi:diguanylate cyclase (GGDEF)-like protein
MGIAEGKPEKPRVLVVDDSRIVRATIAKHIREVYDVREATDGEAGWEALVADLEVRVVISDLSMPRLDGFGLIERIRASMDERIRAMPIIMISGDDEEGPRKRASALGATAFITKGVGSTELLARLAALTADPAAPSQADVDAAKAQAKVESEAEAARVVAAEKAVTDPLTQLSTISFLVKQGAQLFAYARRHQLPLSVMRITLDDFEQMRRLVGDNVSDQILVGVAKLLSSRMRKEDFVARTGASEFAVALPAATRAGAATLAQRLAEEIRQAKILWQGKPLHISASIGVADSVSDVVESFADIYATAARRIDRARANGGGQVVFDDDDAMMRTQPASTHPVAPTVDQALRMLAAGRGGELEAHVAELARAVYPLVKFCDEMFEKAADRGRASSNKAADLLMLKTQPMETLKQQGLLE